MSRQPASGILLVDKEQGWTSHDVVARTRRLAGTRKVGHAGTLDPMATGLLVVGVGSSTRLLSYVVGTDKEYEATIRLGAATNTDDADGEARSWAPAAAVEALSEARLREGIAALTGDIEQVPSSVSAIKVDGKRAYARARAGENVVLAARRITVAVFELLGHGLVGLDDGVVALDVRVRVECSSGTYVRALARDLGAALGVGGHLSALRRTRVGPFRVADAAPLESLDVASRLLSPAHAASALFPRYELTARESIDLGHGRLLQVTSPGLPDGPVAAIAPSGRLVGLVEFQGRQGRALVNFPADEIAADAQTDEEERP